MTDWRAFSSMLRATAPESTCPTIDGPLADDQRPCPDCGEPISRLSRYCRECTFNHRSDPNERNESWDYPLAGLLSRAHMDFEPARCDACGRLFPERRPSRRFCPICASNLDRITLAVADLFGRRVAA